ncbi:MAG: D-2-hydroxyacid dehydrogenase [Phycisphaerales bacterium]|nr:D-2-hydroxyacid dehydrogenase [Phycisphaerales bacterium]
MREATGCGWAGLVAAAAMVLVGGPCFGAVEPELPGSLRNARVAKVVTENSSQVVAPPPLTYLGGALTDAQVKELEAVAPNVRVVRITSRGEAMERAAEADGAEARFLTPEFLAKATKLAWVHATSAGVDRLVGIPGLKEREALVVTNSRGVHGPAIADHAMGMLLSLTRRLPEYRAAQEKQRWGLGEEEERRAATLQGKTMLVVGIGGIGTEVARRAHGFGMRVIATRRSATPVPDFVGRVGKPEELAAILPEADVVAICVPLTPETENLFDDAMLRRMKKGAYLINVARGKIVATDALVAALKEGRLAGAALDVTEPEPLPSGHALWSAPNVLITPHVSADGELTEERWWALYKENVRRFGAGEPLLNCVDVKAGY